MIWPLPKVCVPLNIMCSTQWDMPVIPMCSLRAPTRYHTQKDTTGAECTSFVSKVRPLGKECRSKNNLPFDGDSALSFSCVFVSVILYISPIAYVIRHDRAPERAIRALPLLYIVST